MAQKIFSYKGWSAPGMHAVVNHLKKTMRRSITASDVRDELRQMHEADPREISGVWRVPCRHCYGENHQFQYTNAEMYYIESAHSYGESGWPYACVTNEYGPAITKHATAAYMAGKESRTLDIKGGDGYTRNREINPDCPQCHGHGDTMAYICDTRKLSAGAKKLFKGVKVTNGERIELLTIDKFDVLQLIARDTQVGVERKELTVNLPRTENEFKKMVSKMPMQDLESFISSMITLGEGEYEVNGVEAQLPKPNRFKRGN